MADPQEEDESMPIYEFYCRECNTIFSFLSKTVNTTGHPKCPRCRKGRLSRQVSLFAATGHAREEGAGGPELPIDERKMEQAMESLAGEAESLNAEDPRQAAQMMRKFTRLTGMEMGSGMQEALRRMEAGEDPEQVEAELGERLEAEDPFVLPGQKGRKGGSRRLAPQRDTTLHEM